MAIASICHITVTVRRCEVSYCCSLFYSLMFFGADRPWVPLCISSATPSSNDTDVERHKIDSPWGKRRGSPQSASSRPTEWVVARFTNCWPVQVISCTGSMISLVYWICSLSIWVQMSYALRMRHLGWWWTAHWRWWSSCAKATGVPQQ